MVGWSFALTMNKAPVKRAARKPSLSTNPHIIHVHSKVSSVVCSFMIVLPCNRQSGLTFANVAF